jgi:putative membrane protein
VARSLIGIGKHVFIPFSFYEDLYPLVKFLPSYNLPSGIPPPDQAYNDQNHSVEHLRSRSATPAGGGRDRVADTPMSQSPVSTLRKMTLQGVTPTSSVAGFAGMHKVLTASAIGDSPYSLHYNQPFSQPKLRPARCPPRHHWSEAVPIRYLPFAKHKRMERRSKQALYADSSSFLDVAEAQGDPQHGSQTAQNIPLEITMYMASHFLKERSPSSHSDAIIRHLVLLYRGSATSKHVRSC